MILPALTEARGRYWRSIKYSLFPPLGLATLAAHLDPDDEVELQDEHVEPLHLHDSPRLVVIQVYVTSATRAYRLADHYRARGAYVCLGGLHVTSCPDEALPHAHSIFLGPGDASFAQFLADFRAGHPQRIYPAGPRTLHGLPPVRRDLIKQHRYLVPNSLVVSRGCPHSCDFCYKPAFFAGGRSFYTQPMDDALAEIDRLPGRHLYFLDDHLFGDPHFAADLFDAMRGMNRVWQAAATVQAVLRPGLLEKAVAAGLRSLFVGFETLTQSNLTAQSKRHSLRADYERAVARLHDLGVMINSSFVFGMDDDDASAFTRTVDWAVRQGMETATFHILTPYPGTALFRRMDDQGRLLHKHWDLYDTRHAVYTPARMSPAVLEAGYWRAYREFYYSSSIWHAASTKPTWNAWMRHLSYAIGWKKLEGVWEFLVRTGLVGAALPILERVLAGELIGRRAPQRAHLEPTASPAQRSVSADALPAVAP